MKQIKQNQTPELSLIIPFYNEEQNVSHLFDVIVPIVKDCVKDYEIAV